MYGYAFAEHAPTARGARDDDESSISAPSVRSARSVSSAATSDTASSVDHVHEKPVAAAAPARKKRQKMKEIRGNVLRHCLRYILCYLLAGVIFLAILLPVVFLVIIPAIVQSLVNSQDFPIKGGELVILDPDTLRVTLDTQIKTPLPANISPLNLFLSNGNQSGFYPFLNLTLPSKRISGTTKISIENQTAPITNMTGLTSWFGDLFDQGKVKVKVHSKGTISLGALKSHPHLDKTISLAGLDKLSGFALDKINLLFPPDENGKNIKGSVLVPNHGVLKLSFGDVTFDVSLGETNIGYLTLRNVTLNPGNNTQAFDGQLYIQNAIQNIGPILASQSNALGKGNIELTAKGNSTIVNGQHIKFIEDVINNRQLIAPVSIISLISSVASGILGGGAGSIDGALGEVFGKNSSLMDDIAKHWNISTPEGRSAKAKLNMLKFLL